MNNRTYAALVVIALLSVTKVGADTIRSSEVSGFSGNYNTSTSGNSSWEGSGTIRIGSGGIRALPANFTIDDINGISIAGNGTGKVLVILDLNFANNPNWHGPLTGVPPSQSAGTWSSFSSGSCYFYSDWRQSSHNSGPSLAEIQSNTMLDWSVWGGLGSTFDYGDSVVFAVEFVVPSGFLVDAISISTNAGLGTYDLEGQTAPTANPQSVITNEDAAVAVTLSGSDLDLDSLTYSIVSGPTYGTLSGSAPNLTYTPDPNYNGADSFTFIVNDGALDSAAATVNITVNSVNDPPFFTSGLPPDSVNKNRLYTHLVITGDPDTLLASLVVTANLPSWLTLHDNHDGTATLNGTPTSFDAGTYDITIQVDDGEAVVEQNFTITVTANNNPPSFSGADNQYYIGEGSSLNIAFRFSDPDGDNVIYHISNAPNGASLSESNGYFSWQPSYTQAGLYSITFWVTDTYGAASGQQTVSIQVSDNGDPTPVPTPAPAPTVTWTPQPPAPTPTATNTPPLESTVTPTPLESTSTPTPEVEVVATDTPQPPAPTATLIPPEPTRPPAPRPTATNTSRPASTATATPTTTLSAGRTATPTPTPTPTNTSPPATATPAPPTRTNTPRPTATWTPTPTPVNTPRFIPTATRTPTPTPTPLFAEAVVVVAQGAGSQDTVHWRDTTGRILRSYKSISGAFLSSVGGGIGRGVYVTIGDITNDGLPDVIETLGVITADAIFPNIVILRDRGSFTAFPSGVGNSVRYNNGELRAAVGQFMRVGKNLLAIAQGSGSELGLVRLFQYTGDPPPYTWRIVGQFQPLDNQPQANNADGGVTLAAGDLDGDGLDELLVGQTNSSTSLTQFTVLDIVNANNPIRHNFVGFPAGYRGQGGVEMAVADLNGDGINEIVVASGGNAGTSDPGSLLGVIHPVVENGVITGFVRPDNGIIKVIGNDSLNPSGGLCVSAGDLDNNPSNGEEIVFGTGPGAPYSFYRAIRLEYDPTTGANGTVTGFHFLTGPPRDTNFFQETFGSGAVRVAAFR